MQVDRDDAPAGDRGVLDRQMAEAADAEDGDEVGRAGAGDLDRLVGRDAGAGQRRRVEGVDAFGHLDDVAGVRGGVLAEPAVDRVAHVLLLEAEGLPAGDAVVADAAGVAEPRHRDAVADGDLGHARAELDDDADALMARDERRRGLHGPVAMGGVDVGVAESGRLHPDAHLPELEAQDGDLLDGQRLVEGVDHRGAVGRGGSLGQAGLEGGCCHGSLPWVGM